MQRTHVTMYRNKDEESIKDYFPLHVDNEKLWDPEEYNGDYHSLNYKGKARDMKTNIFDSAEMNDAELHRLVMMVTRMFPMKAADLKDHRLDPEPCARTVVVTTCPFVSESKNRKRDWVKSSLAIVYEKAIVTCYREEVLEGPGGIVRGALKAIFNAFILRSRQMTMGKKGALKKNDGLYSWPDCIGDLKVKTMPKVDISEVKRQKQHLENVAKIHNEAQRIIRVIEASMLSRNYQGEKGTVDPAVKAELKHLIVVCEAD